MPPMWKELGRAAAMGAIQEQRRGEAALACHCAPSNLHSHSPQLCRGPEDESFRQHEALRYSEGRQVPAAMIFLLQKF